MYVFDTIIKLYWKRQNASHRLPLTRLLLAGTKTGWLCWVEFGFYYRTSGMRVDRIGGMKCAVVVREERENYRHRRHTRRSRRPPHTITMKRRGTEKNEKSILKSIKLWILHNYCMCLFSYPRSLSLSLTLFDFSTFHCCCSRYTVCATNDEEWRCCVVKYKEEKENSEQHDEGGRMMRRGRRGRQRHNNELDSRINMSELYWKIQRLFLNVEDGSENLWYDFIFCSLALNLKIYTKLNWTELNCWYCFSVIFNAHRAHSTECDSICGTQHSVENIAAADVELNLLSPLCSFFIVAFFSL